MIVSRSSDQKRRLRNERRQRVSINWPMLIATGGGLGWSPWIPGTLGTLLGAVLLAAMQQGATGLHGSPLIYLITLFAVLVTAWIAINQYLKEIAETESVNRMDLVDPDPQEIVIDEIAGIWLAMTLSTLVLWAFTTPIPFWTQLLATFLVFRILDASKCGPIGWCERTFRGVWGILLDDLMAGVLTGFLVVLGWVAYTLMVW